MPEAQKRKTLYCDFCGKSQHEVHKLIAGPKVHICDECIELCMDIIRNNSAPKLVDVAQQRPELSTFGALLEAAEIDSAEALSMNVVRLFVRLAPLSARFASEIKQSHAAALRAAKADALRLTIAELEDELNQRNRRLEGLRIKLDTVDRDDI